MVGSVDWGDCELAARNPFLVADAMRKIHALSISRSIILDCALAHILGFSLLIRFRWVMFPEAHYSVKAYYAPRQLAPEESAHGPGQ